MRDEARIVELENRLARIVNWCDAYPLDVFPEPDWGNVRELLGDALLTQVSAANMRHVVEGMKKIAGGSK